jgi:hypothetical protein
MTNHSIDFHAEAAPTGGDEKCNRSQDELVKTAEAVSAVILR